VKLKLRRFRRRLDGRDNNAYESRARQRAARKNYPVWESHAGALPGSFYLKWPAHVCQKHWPITERKSVMLNREDSAMVRPSTGIAGATVAHLGAF
jgi:hypothetical protein